MKAMPSVNVVSQYGKLVTQETISIGFQEEILYSVFGA